MACTTAVSVITASEVARMSDDPATESDPLLAVRHTPRSTPALVI
jgi:hypothetical protein